MFPVFTQSNCCLRLSLWFLSTHNRSTNIQKNPLEQLFLDGVFCFVTHSKVAFLIINPQIHRYTDGPSRFFISLFFACPRLIYLRSPLTPPVCQPREEFRSYPGDITVFVGGISKIQWWITRRGRHGVTVRVIIPHVFACKGLRWDCGKDSDPNPDDVAQIVWGRLTQMCLESGRRQPSTQLPRFDEQAFGCKAVSWKSGKSCRRAEPGRCNRRHSLIGKWQESSFQWNSHQGWNQPLPLDG